LSVLGGAAPKREKELRGVQILLRLRPHKTELCLLELPLRIEDKVRDLRSRRAL